MAWQRRMVTLTFLVLVGAVALWAAKSHQSVPLGETCRYGFECIPPEGFVATCVEVCVVSCDEGCPSGTSCDGSVCR